MRISSLDSQERKLRHTQSKHNISATKHKDELASPNNQFITTYVNWLYACVSTVPINVSSLGGVSWRICAFFAMMTLLLSAHCSLKIKQKRMFSKSDKHCSIQDWTQEKFAQCTLLWMTIIKFNCAYDWMVALCNNSASSSSYSVYTSCYYTNALKVRLELNPIQHDHTRSLTGHWSAV